MSAARELIRIEVGDERLIKNLMGSIRVDAAGCFLWTKRLSRDGYGRLTIWKFGMRIDEGAHRVSYMVFRGPISEGLCVCHRCDVRSCINPSHFFLGTKLDNSTDRSRKIVAKGLVSVGSALKNNKDATHIHANKLTYAQVLEIRELLDGSASCPELAKRYGVGPLAIRRIRRGETWQIGSDGNVRQDADQG